MTRQLLGAVLFGGWLLACSGDPSDGSTQAGAETADIGTVNLPLTTETNGVSFRLNKAQFTITGATLANPRVVTPPADTPIDQEMLPTGSYSALLRPGWVLERKGTEANAIFQAVTATLITPNPVPFAVTKGGVTNVFFGFATSAGEVALGQGEADLRISVQDCTEYNGIAAALATFTVDCLGTIDGKSFTVNADGFLTRTFDQCPLNQSKLESIDGLLSLQFRAARLPTAKQCIAGRWSDWKANFDRSGVADCPTWTKQQIIGEATPAQIDKFIPELGRLPQNDDGTRPAFLQQMKEGYIYGVSFAAGQLPPGPCKTAGDCAAFCAGGFPGFVLRNDTTTVLTDPTYWLLDTTYSSAAADPFLKPGYYHPMSYYGPIPGTQFANRHRVAPCPGCVPETCSYYSGIHIHLPLRCDCLDPVNNATCPASDTSCVGYCAP
jgi:hypothetical protein